MTLGKKLMNEQIKELAKQVPNWTYKGVYLGPYPSSLQQFAELIIKDCIEVMESEIVYHYNYIERNKVIGDMTMLVKKRFGIKDE